MQPPLEGGTIYAPSPHPPNNNSNYLLSGNNTCQLKLIKNTANLPPMASISSKNIKQAFLLRAISNSSLTILAPSPTYFWTSSEPITLMKQASVLLATALAQRVLPVPGGPYSRTPLGGSIPRLTNLSGCGQIAMLTYFNNQLSQIT